VTGTTDDAKPLEFGAGLFTRANLFSSTNALGSTTLLPTSDDSAGIASSIDAVEGATLNVDVDAVFVVGTVSETARSPAVSPTIESRAVESLGFELPALGASVCLEFSGAIVSTGALSPIAGRDKAAFAIPAFDVAARFSVFAGAE
jgi:hypothetical protein